MIKTILIKSIERTFYGLGFGIGMGIAFKLIPIERTNKKKDSTCGIRTRASEETTILSRRALDRSAKVLHMAFLLLCSFKPLN